MYKRQVRPPFPPQLLQLQAKTVIPLDMGKAGIGEKSVQIEAGSTGQYRKASSLGDLRGLCPGKLHICLLYTSPLMLLAMMAVGRPFSARAAAKAASIWSKSWALMLRTLKPKASYFSSMG